MAVLKKCKSNSLINILKDLLDIDIKNIRIEHIVKLQNIKEYDFWLHKATIEFKNENKINSFLKFIEKDKIKESIYCYWNLLIEQLKNNTHNISNISNEISIVELSHDEYKSILILRIENSESSQDIAKIYLIDISQYLDNGKNETNNKILFISFTNMDF